MNRVYKIFKKWTVDYIYYRAHIKKTGLTFKEYCCFIYLANDGDFSVKSSIIYGKPIKRSNTYWHVQCALELLVDEVYKFKCDKENPYIIDCGTNIGLSLIYFKKQYPNCKILGYEADPNIYVLCMNNLSQFSFSDIELRNAAVWNENGELQFTGDNSHGGRVDPTNKTNGITVRAERLRVQLQVKVDLLKIDIEGAELLVLKDCEDLLINVDKLFVEYHSPTKTDQQLVELLTILRNAGFRVYIKEAWNSMPNPFENAYQRNSEFDLQLNIFAYRG